MVDWFLPSITTSNVAIAADQAVCIALMITSMCLSPENLICASIEPKTSPMMPPSSELYELIYEIVRLVPKGRVTSYGAIAESLGMRSGARMVGYAMNLSHTVQPAVPAHRVVNSSGLLTGKFHFGSPEKMQQLLEKEGVAVKNDRVQNFESIFWHPKKELDALH